MATKEKLSKQRKGTAKYPHIDDILSGGARSDEDTATQDETNMTVQNQPPAETSEAPVQEPSHSACPHPGCKGNGDDIRHVMVHTMDCRVAGCHLGNPVFPSVRALGAHLIREHNRNDMTVCHWPGCASAGRRARNNHLVHIKLHNHYDTSSS